MSARQLTYVVERTEKDRKRPVCDPLAGWSMLKIPRSIYLASRLLRVFYNDTRSPFLAKCSLFAPAHKIANTNYSRELGITIVYLVCSKFSDHTRTACSTQRPVRVRHVTVLWLEAGALRKARACNLTDRSSNNCSMVRCCQLAHGDISCNNREWTIKVCTSTPVIALVRISTQSDGSDGIDRSSRKIAMGMIW